jgi:PAS domain S-box-containing protein
MPLKVLITEDDSITQKLLSESLKNFGYELIGAARNRTETLSFIEKNVPDLIIMDVNLGGEDGIDISMEIREKHDIPVVFVTGHSDALTIRRIIATESVGYIMKPVKPTELNTVIELTYQRHLLEKRLKENENLLKLTLNSVGDGMIVTDEFGIITLINPAGQTITGYSEEEAKGKFITDIFRIFSNTDSVLYNKEIKEFLLNNIKIEFTETGLEQKNLGKVSVENTFSKIKDEKGLNKGLIITFRNIEDKIAIRETLKNLNEDLQKRVEKSTAELIQKNQLLEAEVSKRQLSEQELTIALEKEKELNELRTRVVTNISHEFRTPLTSILSSVELIQYRLESMPGEHTEKLTKHIRIITNSVKNLNELLNDILFIGKSDSNKVDVNPVKINTLHFFQTLLEEFRAGSGRNHQVLYRSENLAPEIYTDSKLFRQILTNLLSNACKYSPPGTSVVMEIICENNMMGVSITDRGIGIPDEDQPLIFDLFHRAKNTGDFEGTGVGLSIVKRIVDQLQGSISFESRINIGTTFKVLIPETYSGN